jgi:tRNA-dihydrouridine synthase
MRDAFERESDAKITQIQLRKFASWYSSGYPGASTFRKAIFQTETIEETMRLALGFFGELRAVAPADTSQDAFLMGGHG